MYFLILELDHQIVQLFVFWNKKRLAQQACPIKIMVIQIRQQILNIQNTYNLIDIIFKNRNSGIAIFYNFSHNLSIFLLNIKRKNIYSGPHHLSHIGITKRNYPLQYFLFFFSSILFAGYL